MLTIHLGAEFSGLLLQAGISVIEFSAASLIFGQGHDSGHVGFGEALRLLSKCSLSFTQCLSASLQLLRKPMPVVSPLQGVDDRFWLRDELANIAPDDDIQLVCRDVSGPAPFVVSGVKRLGQAAAGIVALAGIGGSRDAGRLTRSTTDQRPQQILMALVVPRCLFHVQSQFLLYLIEDVIGHQSGNRTEEGPLLRRGEISSPSRFAERVRG